MKNLKYIIIVFTASILTLTGCNEEFLEISNPNAYSEDSYFTTASQLEEAVAAAYYGFLHKGLYTREWYFFHDILGNDAKAAPAMVGTGGVGQLPTVSFDGTNSEIQELWRSLYRIVLRSTIAEEKAMTFQAKGNQEEAIKARVLGEASFLKAWTYWSLYRLWGAVPLRKTLEDMKIKNYPRAESEEAIISYIMELLDVAENNLPVEWNVEYTGRVTKGAALAVRGQVYMWQQEWAAAESEFEKLAQAPYDYQLADNFFDNHNEAGENNVESIFEIQHLFNPAANVWYMFGGQESWGPDQASTGRAMEYGFNDWFNVFVSPSTVNAFTYQLDGESYVDPRAYFTFYGDEASGGDHTYYCEECEDNEQEFNFEIKGYTWKKYQRYEERETEGVPQSPINSRVIRYADVLLMKAEAQIAQNKLNEALANINEVRERAGAGTYESLGNQSEAMGFLKRERRLELAGEQVRFFDLIRWGELIKLNDEKAAQAEGRPYSEKHVKFPIPSDELDINQEMVDNLYFSGWN